jgi:hypothetical protein
VQNENGEFILIPETEQVITADKENTKAFVAPSPCFKTWIGVHHENLSPEAFGKIIASRDDEGDVAVKDDEAWRKVMSAF